MGCNRVIFSASFDCSCCCKNPFCRERKRNTGCGCGCWSSNCFPKAPACKPRCCFANCSCVDDFKDGFGGGYGGYDGGCGCNNW